MGLPIAIGGQNEFSRSIPKSDDVVTKSFVTAVGTNADSSLSATVTIAYLSIMSTVEVNVEITDLCTIHSPEMPPRSTVKRFRMAVFEEGFEPDEESHSSKTDLLKVSVCFSSDSRYLACLVPQPKADASFSSCIIIFTLKQRGDYFDDQPPPFPLPSFIEAGSNGGVRPASPPTAFHPKVVTGEESVDFGCISSICDADGPSSTSVLLAGCVDGSILAIAYKRAKLAGVLYHPADDEQDGGEYERRVISMEHYAFQNCLQVGSASGRLAIIRNDLVIIYSSSFFPSVESRAGIMMKIEPLAVKKENDNSILFGHVRWISNNLIALARGDSTDRGDYDYDQQGVAQVWSIQTDGEIMLVSELSMTCDRLNEKSHATYSLLHFENHNSTQVDNDHVKNPLLSGLHFDSASGCLAVSGVVNSNYQGAPLRSFVCIWDWSTSVIGLTLSAEVDTSNQYPSVSLPHTSCLFFGHKGRSLFHIYGRETLVIKHVYETGVLGSPETTTNGYIVQEASPLFLSSSYVGFPFLLPSSKSPDSIIEWNEYLIPGAYVTAHGPPQISTIGRRFGSSVAVASSRGVCILDLARPRPTQTKKMPSPCVLADSCTDQTMSNGKNRLLRNNISKWRMFGNESDERAFRVHAMTWWERNRGAEGSESCSNDLLFAVIEKTDCSSIEEESEASRFFLVCWSRRRLGKGEDQLLVKPIKLPHGVSPETISLLPEPNIPGQTSEKNDKAIILICSASLPFRGKYAAYRVQAIRNPSQHLDQDKFPQHLNTECLVLASLCSTGYIPCIHNCHTKSSPPSSCMINGVFLAGASFNFDLLDENERENQNEHEYIATLGIVSFCAGGLSALSITTEGPSHCCPLLTRKTLSNILENGNSHDQVTAHPVAKYWMSDIIFEDGMINGRFVWTVAATSGEIFCWSVPFFSFSRQLEDIKKRTNGFHNMNGSSDSEKPVRLSAEKKSSFGTEWSLFALPRSYVINSDGVSIATTSNGMDSSYLQHLGQISCALGDSSIWMNGASSINNAGSVLGPLPHSNLCCVLYSGQQSRTVSSPTLTSSQFNIFGLDDCLVNPPAFTPSLLSSLVAAAASVSMSQPHTDTLVCNDGMIPRRHALSLCQSRPYDNCICIAIQVIVLRILELLNDAIESTEQKDEQEYENAPPQLNFAKSLLREAILIASVSLSPLQFSELFIGIGRQLEPHHFSCLFPLPVIYEEEKKTEITILSQESGAPIGPRTINDLFLIALRCSSIKTASSALPLFGTKKESHRKCIALLSKCLDTVANTIDLSGHNGLEKMSEEIMMIPQLFRFGMKLEETDDNGELDDTEVNDSDFDILSNSSHIDCQDDAEMDIISLEKSFSSDSSLSHQNDLDEAQSHNLLENSEGNSESSAERVEESLSESHNRLENSESNSESSAECVEETLSHCTDTHSSDTEPHTSCSFKMNILSRLGVSQIFWKEEPVCEDAVCKAATSFINSGFDSLDISQEEHAIFRQETNGSVPTSTDSLSQKNSSPRSVNGCIRTSSVFYEIGYWAEKCPRGMKNILPFLIEDIIGCMDAKYSICSDILWAVGRILRISPPEVLESVVEEILEKLVCILVRNDLNLHHANHLILVGNAAACLGRLACICNEKVSKKMDSFFIRWCENLALISNPIEKKDGFEGMLLCIDSNQDFILSSHQALSALLLAMASWHIPSELATFPKEDTLCVSFGVVLREIKKKVDKDTWEKATDCSLDVMSHLSKIYQV